MTRGKGILICGLFAVFGIACALAAADTANPPDLSRYREGVAGSGSRATARCCGRSCRRTAIGGSKTNVRDVNAALSHAAQGL